MFPIINYQSLFHLYCLSLDLAVIAQNLASMYVQLIDTAFIVAAAPPDREERQNSLDSQIRLSNGCSGILEVLTSLGRYGTATDRNFGANEARVACRQLGCLRGNIQPVRTNTGV